MRRRLHGIDPWRFASADDPEWHPDGDARSTFGARSRSLFDFRTLEAQDQPRVPLRVWSGRCEVFERFTDGARECVVLGQEEAYAAEADAVGTEHMLLGLLDQGDQLVADALRVAGFPERAAQVSLADPRPNREVHIPFSPEAAAVLRRSREVSAALGEAQTRPGHLLLALLPSEDTSQPLGDGAEKLLREQGVDVVWLRTRLLGLLQSR